jgi:AcrR family transcriptional regulator
MAADQPGRDEALPPQLARLPPGRHGLPRDFVAANHRDRLVAACSQQVQEHGYEATTVATIIKAAAVSRRTFYEHFDDKESCFIATYDLLVEFLRARIFAAFEAESSWPQQVRAALAVALNFFAEQPGLARLVLIEPLAAGPPVSEHHREAVAGFAPLLAGGPKNPAGSNRPEGETEGAMVAGLVLLITRRVVAGQAKQLPEQLPELLATALTPFLGATEAERIARE